MTIESEMKLWNASYHLKYSYDNNTWYEFDKTNDTWWSTTPINVNTIIHHWSIVKSTDNIIVENYHVQLANVE